MRNRSEYTKSCLKQIHKKQTGDEARRTDMTEQDIETLRARAEAVEQQDETLQVSLGAAQIDVRDLIESREANRLETAKLSSRAQDIEAGFWDLERNLGP
ncbi:hypothetical protein Tco_0003344 [Tanacetum coccineum]